MDRVKRGFRLVGASWRVLRDDEQLVWLPVVSMVSILVFAALTLGPVLISADTRSQRTTVYGLLAVVYLVSSFVAVFFNAAIVAAAGERLAGRPGTARDGIRLAWSKVMQILLWALITATVGLVVRQLESRSGVLGAIVFRIAGAAWSALTFFVVPVLVFEGTGPVDAMRRSGHLFRERWGEQLVGNGSIGLALSCVGIAVVGVAFVLARLALPLGIAFGVVGLAVLLAVGSALSGIFNAALYRYAVSGTVSGPYDEGDFRSAFRRRRGL